MPDQNELELEELRLIRIIRNEKLAALDKAEEEYHKMGEEYWDAWMAYRAKHNIGGRELNKILFPNEDWDNLGYVGATS